MTQEQYIKLETKIGDAIMSVCREQKPLLTPVEAFPCIMAAACNIIAGVAYQTNIEPKLALTLVQKCAAFEPFDSYKMSELFEKELLELKQHATSDETRSPESSDLSHH